MTVVAWHAAHGPWHVDFSIATINVDGAARSATAITATERRVAVRQRADSGSEQDFVRIEPRCENCLRIRRRRQLWRHSGGHDAFARRAAGWRGGKRAACADAPDRAAIGQRAGGAGSQRRILRGAATMSAGGIAIRLLARPIISSAPSGAPTPGWRKAVWHGAGYLTRCARTATEFAATPHPGNCGLAASDGVSWFETGYHPRFDQLALHCNSQHRRPG
jgi:hypothetical protein